MPMIKLALLGYSGRMGQAIALEIAARDSACKLVSGVVRAMKPQYKKAEGILVTSHADEAISIADVVIDFTLADAVAANARMVAAHKKTYVCGVTALDNGGKKALKASAAKIPVL
jgi:4-hydroxy-tetrahydrodipicolinate reductase